MNDRPSYKCYLAHHYSWIQKYGLIECKKEGQTGYYKNVTKKGRRFVCVGLPALLFILLLLAPLVYLLVSDGFWYASDYAFLMIVALYVFLPLVSSIGYRYLSFQIVDSEAAAAKRAEYEKKQYFGRTGAIISTAVIRLLIVLSILMQTYTCAYIHYSIDRAVQNQAYPPSARVSLDLDHKTIQDDQYTISGSIPLEGTVEVNVNVTNSPYEPSVLLNGIPLSGFARDKFRSHNGFFPIYFSYSYYYYIPSSLFKPVNTLHVGSGLAKGDWMIEITPTNKY